MEEDSDSAPALFEGRPSQVYKLKNAVDNTLPVTKAFKVALFPFFFVEGCCFDQAMGGDGERERGEREGREGREEK